MCGYSGAAQSSSMLCSFCVPFLLAMFSITPSTVTTWTFNYIFAQHTHSQYSSLEASHNCMAMEWKYGKNQGVCCLSLASSDFPTPALCVYKIMRNRFFRKEMKGHVRQKERSEGQCWGEADSRPVSQHHQPTHPAARWPSKKIHTQVTLLPAFISVYWHVKDCNNIGQDRDF